MAKTLAAKTERSSNTPSEDWRMKTLDHIRALIREAAPEANEEAKWKKATKPGGVPVWSQDGIICTGESYKDKVKITFFRGAVLRDPSSLFNAGFGGGTRRAIDIGEGEPVNARAFKALVKEAIKLNSESRDKRKKEP